MGKNKVRRYRLNDVQVQKLGLEANKSNRYRLSKEQEIELLKLKENFEIKTETKINDYKPKQTIFTAVSPNGGIMNIETYCKHYGLDFEKVRSFKLVSHTGTPFYNIAFYESEEEKENFEEIKTILESELSKVYNHKTTFTESNEIDNLVISDLHVGSYIDGLVKTKDYSIPILVDYLEQTAYKVNKNNAKKVNVLCLGDLIESFTGLNHKNSWKGLQKGMIGAEVVKFTAKILHEKLLSKINNLGFIQIVAGNHDRLTSDKAEDVDGGAADLVAFALELMGYEVEFHPTVISSQIDGINYILLHGHKGISKKTTEQICWMYGVQGMFNVILEGHLHSYVQKLSTSQRNQYKTVKDDSTDTLRMHCRSYFTGNGFSEDLGYTSNAGYTIIRNNGKGLPEIDNKLL
jgi:predicted phosphodiesterase